MIQLGFSTLQMSRRITRLRCCVRNYVRDRMAHGSAKPTGHPRIPNDRDERSVIGIPIPYIAYIGITTTFLLGPAVIFFFEDRYNTLVRRDSEANSRKVKRIIFYTINYAFILVALVPTLVNAPNQDEAKALTLKEFPCLPPYLVNTPGFYRATNNAGVATSSLMFVILVEFGQISFFFAATALKVFNMKTASKRTSEMQKQLFKCLCIQVIIPIVIICVPCSYVVGLTAISHLDQAANNIACILVTLYGVLSTICMLVIHKPYRLATVQLFQFRKLTVPTSLFVGSLN
uniref:Uncharacterized protein n=1 Tax=Caenorhabditis japonica TaxID=281687 RepID=A0A8R1DQN5_CAEJA